MNRCLLLWCLGVVCVGIFFNSPVYAASRHMAPASVPGSEMVDSKRAKELFDQGAVFVDVRSVKSWKQGHIPRAVHLDLLKSFSLESLEKHQPDKQGSVVIYCNGPLCLRSSIATAKAVNWGFQSVYYFRGGYPEWVDQGLPIVYPGQLVSKEEEEIPML